MTRAHPDRSASHLRLSPETWAEIAQAYRNGATARELARKWKVSPHSIYRYACRDGFTKKAGGDAVARAHAAAVEAEDEAARAAIYGGRRDDGGGDASTDPAPPPAAEPEALRQRALEDLARAMAAGRVDEASRLARLALTLAKVAPTTAAGDGRPVDAEASEMLEEGECFIDPAEPPDSPKRKAWARFAMRLRRQGDLSAERWAEEIWPLIEKTAIGMLGDRRTGPALFSRETFRWRAKTFGPECAANDYEVMRAGGWAKGIYDDEGNILPGWDYFSRLHPKYGEG